MDQARLTASNSTDDHERLIACGNFLGQRHVGRTVRKVFLAGEESHKPATLVGDIIANCSAKHWVLRLECVEDRPCRHRAADIQPNLTASACQFTKMLWENDADHGRVCASTETTAGKSLTIGFQLSPESADA